MKSMEEVFDLIKKYQVESFNYSRGIICSEKTAKLLKDKFESISEKKVSSIVAICGIPICAEKYFTEEMVWVLNKELWEIYLKEGLAGLIKRMAININIRKKV